MRAMAYDAYGSDDVLTLRELPDPKVGPGEVRIRVRRAGVNPVDWKVMAGGLDGLMDVVFPVVPGWDVAGTVESVGVDTPEFEVGDGVVERIREAAPDGVDVVADFVGGVREVTMAVLAVGGRHASIADSTVLETGGSWFWVRPSAEGLAELGRMADAGQLRVPVADVLPLEELPAAFALSREGHVRGKLVISVSD